MLIICVRDLYIALLCTEKVIIDYSWSALHVVCSRNDIDRVRLRPAIDISAHFRIGLFRSTYLSSSATDECTRDGISVTQARLPSSRAGSPSATHVEKAPIRNQS